MGGFGDLLGGLSELFVGLSEAAGERGGEAALEFARGRGGPNDDPPPAATVDRYLTGAPRVLNVNDR